MTPSTVCYLERIDISNFRAFGEGFSLTLPPGPGVTLIYGPNGLGKTTFFDAIEWCLTGNVKHFQAHRRGAAAKHEQHLTRINAPLQGSHRVSLYFTGAEPLDRGPGLAPSSAEVVALLKRANWPGVGNLGSYLALTHFLGQSASERFSVQSPEEQWEILQGPAGVDRIDLIRDRLGGQGTRSAFTRQINLAEGSVTAARRALAEIESLVANVERAQSLGRARDAISPNQLLEQARRLSEFLARSLPSPITLDDTGAPESWLELLNDAVWRVRQHADAAVAEAATLEPLVIEIEQLRAEEDLLAREVSERTGAREALSQQLADLTTERAAAASVDDETQRELHTARAVVSACDQLFASLADVDLGMSRRDAVRARLAEIDEALTAGQRSQEKLEQELARIEALATTLAAATREAEQCREASVQLAIADQTLAPHVAALAGVSVSETITAMDDRAASASERRGELRARVQRLEAELAATDARLERLAALASQVRGLLQPDDETCPICATAFPVGALLAQAESASTASIGGARGRGAELAAATSALLEVDRELDAIAREKGRILEHHAAVVETTQQRDAILARVRRLSPDAPPASIDDIRRLVGVAEEAGRTASLALAGMRDELTVRRDLDDDAHKGEHLRDVRTTLESELAEVTQRIEASKGLVAELSQSLGLTGDSRGAAAGKRANASNALVALTLAAAERQEVRDRLEQSHRDLTDRIREAERALGVAERQSSALRDRLAERRERWATVDTHHAPTLAGAWALREAAESRSREAQSADEQLAKMVDGFAAWRDDALRTALEQSLQAQCDLAGVTSAVELREVKEAAVRDAETQVAQLREAQGQALALAETLKSETDRFTQGVLKPLNATIRQFSRALMLSADDSLHLRARFRASRSEFQPIVMRRDEQGNVVELERDPNLYFSEGQLSAQSVSALFAASTTFRWSRWPALLLDDPLQHNDVIHGAAFIDLVRRLVEKLNYQVLLSTHDSDEAEFIARKCEGSGIPFRLCQLKRSGVDGVIAAS